MESNPARETCHEHKTVHVQDYLKARFLNMVNKNEERLHLFFCPRCVGFSEIL